MTHEDSMSVEAKILRELGLTDLALAAGFDLDEIQIYGTIGFLGDQMVRVTRRGEGGHYLLVGPPDNYIFFYTGSGGTVSKVSLKVDREDIAVHMSGPPEKLVAALMNGVRQ